MKNAAIDGSLVVDCFCPKILRVFAHLCWHAKIRMVFIRFSLNYGHYITFGQATSHMIGSEPPSRTFTTLFSFYFLL